MKKYQKLNSVLYVVIQAFLIFCIVLLVYNKTTKSKLFINAIEKCYDSKSYQEFNYGEYLFTIDFIPDGNEETIDNIIDTAKNSCEFWDSFDVNNGKGVSLLFDETLEVTAFYEVKDGVFLISGSCMSDNFEEHEEEILNIFSNNKRHIDKALSKYL